MALEDGRAARAARGGQTQRCVVPIVDGFAAYEGRGAIRCFEAALPETVRIGGSRAQRDLVEHTLLAAYLKAGRPEDARRLVAKRSDRRATVAIAGFHAG
jgi:pentatricopeptide repeat protein